MTKLTRGSVIGKRKHDLRIRGTKISLAKPSFRLANNLTSGALYHLVATYLQDPTPHQSVNCQTIQRINYDEAHSVINPAAPCAANSGSVSNPLASPKSHILSSQSAFTWKSINSQIEWHVLGKNWLRRTSRFPGLRSRCKTLAEWMYWYQVKEKD